MAHCKGKFGQVFVVQLSAKLGTWFNQRQQLLRNLMWDMQQVTDATWNCMKNYFSFRFGRIYEIGGYGFIWKYDEEKVWCPWKKEKVTQNQNPLENLPWFFFFSFDFQSLLDMLESSWLCLLANPEKQSQKSLALQNFRLHIDLLHQFSEFQY